MFYMGNIFVAARIDTTIPKAWAVSTKGELLQLFIISIFKSNFHKNVLKALLLIP